MDRTCSLSRRRLGLSCSSPRPVKSAKGRTVVSPPVSQDRYGFENPRYQFHVTRMKFGGCGGCGDCAERPRLVVSRRKPAQTDLAIHRMLRCARAYRPIQSRARGGIRNRQTSPPRATLRPMQSADGERETEYLSFPSRRKGASKSQRRVHKHAAYTCRVELGERGLDRDSRQGMTERRKGGSVDARTRRQRAIGKSIVPRSLRPAHAPSACAYPRLRIPYRRTVERESRRARPLTCRITRACVYAGAFTRTFTSAFTKSTRNLRHARQ